MMKKYKLGDINMEEVALFIRDPKDDIEASVSYGHGAIFKHFPLGTPNESILNWGKDEFGRMFDEFCHLCDLGYVMDPEGDWMKIDNAAASMFAGSPRIVMKSGNTNSMTIKGRSSGGRFPVRNTKPKVLSKPSSNLKRRT